jgi:hypothetical protein
MSRKTRGKAAAERILSRYHETGDPSFEIPQKRGRTHGTTYRWDEPGVLLSTEPYVDGLPTAPRDNGRTAPSSGRGAASADRMARAHETQ